MIIARYDAILNQSERAHLYNHLSNYTKGYYTDIILTGIDSGMPAVLRLVMVCMKRGRYILNAGREDVKSYMA